MKKRHFHFSTAQLIMLSFLSAILLGSVLLSLPCATNDGHSIPYVDALFTATSATCVTGLVTLSTVSTFSTFGQVVLLCLIQIGGLGIITVTAGIMLILHRRMGLGDRLLIQDAFNLNSLSGIVRFVKKVFIGTAVVEGAGALLYMTVFVPRYGPRGIWISVFNAVSAFCNAGIDILSENSLCEYATHPLINFVTLSLIILGGLGYIVWWDVLRVVKLFPRQKFRCLANLTLHSKIVLTTTSFLLFVGTAAFLIFEYDNSYTLGGYSLLQKLQLAFFQSTTTRTAGFFTVQQQYLTNPSALVALFLMFVGGSPVGTAGGIKTVTLVVLGVSALAAIQNKNEPSLFGRSISKAAVNKALAVFSASFITAFLSALLLSAVTDAPMLDVLYEAVSATATVGLTRNLTASLNMWGKLIITATMYLGRVGPISLATAFMLRKETKNIVRTPTETLSVG